VFGVLSYSCSLRLDSWWIADSYKAKLNNDSYGLFVYLSLISGDIGVYFDW